MKNVLKSIKNFIKLSKLISDYSVSSGVSTLNGKWKIKEDREGRIKPE